MSTRLEQPPTEDVLELNMTQQGMLYHYLRDAGSNAFTRQVIVRVAGTLDVPALRESLRLVAGKHAALRSAFEWGASGPRQVVRRDVTPDLEVLELSGAEPGGADAAWRAYFDRVGRARFDLAVSPWRFGVVKLSPESYRLHLTHHGIVCDAEGARVLVRAWFDAYDALRQNRLPAGAAGPAYGAVHRAAAERMRDQAGAPYWQEYLRGYDVVNLGAASPGAEESHAGPKTIAVTGPMDGLDAFCLTHGVSRQAVLYAAYGVLLQKYLFAADVVFGTAVSLRPGGAESAGAVIGQFGNVVPLRLVAGGAATVLETIRAVQAALAERKAHEGTSYFSIKRLAGLLPTAELFDSVVVIDEAGLQPVAATGPSGFTAHVVSDHEQPGFPLQLRVWFGAEPGVQLAYRPGVIADDTAESLAHRFHRAVREMIADAGRPVRALDLLSAAERDELLRGTDEPDGGHPASPSLVARFGEQVAKNPLACAVRDAHTSLSYAELGRRVNQLRHFLGQHNVQRDAVVALLMDRSIEFVISALAVVQCGAVYLPLDPGLKRSRIGEMLGHSGAVLLLTNTDILRRVNPEGSVKIVLYDAALGGINLLPADASGDVEGDNLYVIYTSGTSGTPKGVLGSRRGLLNRLHWGWAAFPNAAGEIHCFKTSVGLVDHVAEMFSPLLAGVPLRIFSDEEVMDISRFYALLVREKITRITLVPTYLKALKELRINTEPEPHSLRYVFSSGEALPYRLAQEFYREFSDVVLVNIYGSTEVSADVTCYRVERDYVDDVLKYFKRYALGDSRQDTMHRNFITAPDVTIEATARNFHRSRVPEYPSEIGKYLDHFEKDVLPYTVNTSSPRFIGHMTSVLPDFVHDVSKRISELNQNLVKIETSKSLTFLEREAIGMLHRMFYGFTDDFYGEHIQKLNANLGIITSGGSTANISCLLAARNKLVAGLTTTPGGSIYQVLRSLGYEDFVLIGSHLMHYSFRKAASLFGLGTDNVLYVRTGDGGGVDLEDLQAKITDCREKKLLVIAVVGIAGSTETGSIDPLRGMGEIARRNGIHFHVDAAWGGLLKFSDQFAPLLDGIELADSVTFCGHKQLFLPQGISVCLFRDPYHLNFNSTVANYQASARSYDFGRVTIEGSKPALSLCLHAALNVLGKKGYELLLERGMALADLFARMIGSSDAFELVSKNINIINYRYVPAALRGKQPAEFTAEEVEWINGVNTQIQEAQFLKGRTFVSKTTVRGSRGDGQVVFRVVLSNPLTTRQDLECVINDQFVIIGELFGETNTLPYVSSPDGLPADRLLEQPGDGQPAILIGKPIAHTQVLILDQFGGLQPTGVAGEICVSGLALSNGYLNNAPLDEPKFSDNPFRPGERLYRTGDYGRRLPDGNMEYLGRLDDQIKIRGYRVEPGEVEGKLMAYPGVTDAAVAAQYEGGEKSLVAYVVSDSEIAVRSIRGFLAGSLPDHMIPARFVRLPEIPRTPAGKVDRRALATRPAAGDPAYGRPSEQVAQQLGELWNDVLGAGGPDDRRSENFFERGGNSLNLVTLAGAIERKWSVAVPLSFILANPELKTIAAYIEHATATRMKEKEIAHHNRKNLSGLVHA